MVENEVKSKGENQNLTSNVYTLKTFISAVYTSESLPWCV